MNIFLNNSKKRGANAKVLLGGLGFIMVIFVLSIFSTPIKNAVYTVSCPIQKAFLGAGVSSSGFFETVFSSSGLKQENENLKIENQKLLTQISGLQDAKEQNLAITEILGNNQQNDFKLFLANVIGLDSEKDIILIDKGKDYGLTENMSIINSQKVLFGKISKVYNNFSEVMLLSSKNSIFDVKIQKDDQGLPTVYGVIKGNGNLNFSLDLVPTEAEINSGDVLATSALEGIFPKDLLVGKIKDKFKDDLKPFQTASVLPFFDIRKTDKLFVITNYKK
jgi:rod shape-determining protein MreC